MKLGFVSAILPELSLAEVLESGADAGYDCVELMCWPHGPAERRYAGVTHLDVSKINAPGGAAACEEFHRTVAERGLTVSALGYYPNPLSPDAGEAALAIDHLHRVIEAAGQLGIGVVNTFVGRDPGKTVDENWPRFLEVWPPIVKGAEDAGVKIGIENCPMYFTADEWPGGKNLATTPVVWRRMFDALPSPSFGLNYDPSHLVWQRMDHVAPLAEFAERIFHVHAKDVAIDAARLAEVGVMATPLEYHTPRLPGRGEIDWPAFFAALCAIGHDGSGYDGAVCLEVEDRDYEGTLADRQRALREGAAFLRGAAALRGANAQ